MCLLRGYIIYTFVSLETTQCLTHSRCTTNTYLIAIWMDVLRKHNGSIEKREREREIGREREKEPEPFAKY